MWGQMLLGNISSDIEYTQEASKDSEKFLLGTECPGLFGLNTFNQLSATCCQCLSTSTSGLFGTEGLLSQSYVDFTARSNFVCGRTVLKALSRDAAQRSRSSQL